MGQRIGTIRRKGLEQLADTMAKKHETAKRALDLSPPEISRWTHGERSEKMTFLEQNYEIVGCVWVFHAKAVCSGYMSVKDIGALWTSVKPWGPANQHPSVEKTHMA